MNDIDQVIDKVLSHPETIEPSPFFAARVMGAVRAAQSLPPLPFPVWRLSAAVFLLLVFVAGVLVAP